ncbi:unnamed protein product [Haemonchus placei]|uniref:mitogen-activated protein kinase kinase n=1 Tax=Haemonchus placei TaxID=6290 RepID=A0A0N4VS35_HAEPC|nr:unnamed protein product [Haemonchus placei]
MNEVSETHNVIHRDVKPSNILLDWNGSVKLCDFGISGQLIESRAHTVQAGCPPYMAPERFDPRFNSDYDIRSDVWSVGISLIEIATGRYPYSHIDSEFAILAAIVRDPPPTLPMMEDTLEAAAPVMENSLFDLNASQECGKKMK